MIRIATDSKHPQISQPCAGCELCRYCTVRHASWLSAALHQEPSRPCKQRLSRTTIVWRRHHCKLCKIVVRNHYDLSQFSHLARWLRNQPSGRSCLKTQNAGEVWTACDSPHARRGSGNAVIFLHNRGTTSLYRLMSGTSCQMRAFQSTAH